MTAPTVSRPVPSASEKGLDLVGLRDIATRLETNPRTPTMWRNRSNNGLMNPPMPQPIGHISTNRPVYDWSEIFRWAKQTGRLPSQRKAGGVDGPAPVVFEAPPVETPAEAKGAVARATARRKVTARDRKILAQAGGVAE